MRGVTLPRIRLHDLRHSSILVTLDVYSHLTQHQILILTAVRDRPAQPNSRPPHVAYGGPQPATVNWSGIGSVSPGDATAYAAMIVAASEIAEAWT